MSIIILFWGTIKGFKSPNINELKKDEEKAIVEEIIKFIVGVKKLKKMVR